MTNSTNIALLSIVGARLDYFSSRGAVGTLQVIIDSDTPVHVFVRLRTDGSLYRLTDGRLTSGNYHFVVGLQTGVSFNDIIAAGTLYALLADDNLGTVNPTTPVTFRVNLAQIPVPTIVSAVGGINKASIAGTAMSGAKMMLALAGQEQEGSKSVYPANLWTAEFTGVPSGSHTVTVRATDPFGTFESSPTASKELESAGVIVRPLAVTSPPPGWEVERDVVVIGVATTDRGPVLIQIGDGPVKESTVYNQNWSDRVYSGAHGQEVPLRVWLPATGEEISYTLKVKEYGDPKVTRFVIGRDRSAGMLRQVYIIEGTLDFDDRLYYHAALTDGQYKFELATRQDDGTWSYFGFPNPRFLISRKVIDGKSYETVELSVESNPVSLIQPILNEAPTLTSPRTVGQNALLYGLMGGRIGAVSVIIPGRERHIISASADPDGREWALQLEGLPLGTMNIELLASGGEPVDYMSERAVYVLNVVANPSIQR